MGLFSAIFRRNESLFGANNESNYKKLACTLGDEETALAYKIYAIYIAISRLSNSISMCEFETYLNKKLHKDFNWWKLNYEPNKNQDKVKFWQKAIEQAVINDDGALIIQGNDGELIVAEDFDVREYQFEENIYYNIKLADDFKLRSTRTEKEVIRLKINNNRVKAIIDDVYKDYGRLLGGTIRNYNRGNAMKVIVKIGAMFDQFKLRVDPKTNQSEYDMILDDLMKQRLKGLLSDRDSATPIEDGLELEEVNTTANTKSGAVTTRDITATFDDVMNIVADAFHIPRGLLKGDVADVEAMTDNYINYAIRPLAVQIESEFNRKLYGKEKVSKGTKLRVDTSAIKTRNPVDFANAAEALLRIGAYSVNDVRQKLGEEVIDEAWAYEHFITKNYDYMKGGKDESKEEDKTSG